jgi:hypothetical protein
MSRPRMSLAGLMVLVLGIAALRDASETWAGIVHLLTLGLLGVSILGVVYRSGGRRAWWLGFGLFGWGYAALTLAPWSKPEKLPTCVLFALVIGIGGAFVARGFHANRERAGWGDGA